MKAARPTAINLRCSMLLLCPFAATLLFGCGLDVTVRLHDAGFTARALAEGGLAVVDVTATYPIEENAPARNTATNKRFRHLLAAAHRKVLITDAQPLRKALGEKGFARLRQMAAEKTNFTADPNVPLSILPPEVPVFLAWLNVTFSKTGPAHQRKRIYGGVSEDGHTLYAYQTTLTVSRTVSARLKIYDRTRGVLVWVGSITHNKSTHAEYVESDDLLEINERRQSGERFAWPEPPSYDEMVQDVFDALARAF